MNIRFTKRYKNNAVGDVVDLTAGDAAAVIALGLGEEVVEPKDEPAPKKGEKAAAAE